MLINYLKTALRAIRKDKQHFFLNLIGFSIGIAAAILMALFVQHELSYDKHQPDSERVYLAHSDYSAVGLQAISYSSFKIAEKVMSQSRVESVLRLAKAEEAPEEINDLVEINGDYHKLNDFYVSSSNILDFVELTIIAGDIISALSQPSHLVLSEREATRLFGHSQAIDQLIGKTINHAQGLYTLGAIFKDLPDNTHFKFSSLIQMPISFMKEKQGYAYYKVLPETDITALTQQLTKESHILSPWQIEQNVKIKLVNMESLHFKNGDPVAMKTGGSSIVLQISIGLSVILIIIASINFINLNIAHSSKRAKEVGVRKALGATKAQLIIQFLTESFLVVVLAGLIAFVFVEIALSNFNRLMGKELYLDFGSAFIWEIVAIILAVGLLSGLYPATFISSFSAKRVLSGEIAYGGSAILIRKLTLCFQSALSIGLIIGAVSLYQQMQLITNLQVGYEKSSRLVVKTLPSDALYKKEHNSLFNAIKSLPSVEQVTASNTDLTSDMNRNLQFTWPNGKILEVMQPSVTTSYYPVETLGLKLLAGRDFSPKFASDWFYRDEDDNSTISILVSRRMAELAGYQNLNSVIGLTLIEPRYNNMKAKVVGVIENVKIGSARQQVLPMSVNLGLNVGPTSNLVIKVSDTNMAILSKKIQKIIYKELHLSDVNISAISDDYANAHKNEQRALEMVTVFSFLAIFLTFLGTFGLASFSTLNRQKEVAMRKVLGASRLSIVNLLAKEFLVLVAFSIVIAYPLTYWLLGDWLSNFNERIEQTLWVYVFAGISVAAITWLTVASLVFKAASTRPSLILRDE